MNRWDEARMAAADRIIADQTAALAQARAALVRANQVIEEAIAAFSGHSKRRASLTIASDGRVTQFGEDKS